MSSYSDFTKNWSAKTPLLGIIILIVIVAGLVADNKSDQDNFYDNIIRLEKVATKIHKNYVEDMSSEELVDKAINGMLDILDPHTSYFKKKQYEELRIHTEGQFGGLGIQISIRDKVLTVMTPISGTPASRAGIQSGDQIIKIEGKSTKGITIDKAVGKLRGEPGSEVTITIRRKGVKTAIDYTITREIIRIKSVPFYGVVGDGIGYVRLVTFSQDASDEVERAIKELLKKDLKGFVFDLRSNPGGLLPQAIRVSEKFLPRKRLVVSTRGRIRGQNKEFYAGSNPVLPEDLPLAVLVNRASASASEIVSGAIQDWDRGIVLGDTTFGKGSVQSILPIDDKHHLKLTTAFYYTPSGRCINKPENDIPDSDNGDADEEGEANSDSDADTTGQGSKSVGDTTKYRTNKGRIVYGGGGIIPDTVVEGERASFTVRALFMEDAFFKFANQEYPKLSKIGEVIDEKFTVSDAIMKDFYQFLDSIDFDLESYTEQKFKDFKKIAGLKTDDVDSVDNVDSVAADESELELKLSDKELATLEELSHKIESLLESANQRLMKKEETLVKDFLSEALLTRQLGQDHEIVQRRKLEHDEQLNAAMAILHNKSVYTDLLSVAKE